MLDKIWNHRLGGIPMATWLAVSIAFARLSDRISTIFWSANLRACGAGTVIQWGVTIRRPGFIEIGSSTAIGQGSTLASETEAGQCVIGRGVIINPNVHLDFTGGLIIDDDVVISKGVEILTHTHGLNPKGPSHPTPLHIEADVWIGHGVVVVDGASRIGRGAIVAAGSVVTKPIPDWTLCGGVPAKFIRAFTPTERFGIISAVDNRDIS